MIRQIVNKMWTTPDCCGTRRAKSLFLYINEKYRTVLRLVSHMTMTSLGFRADKLYSPTDKKLDVLAFGK